MMLPSAYIKLWLTHLQYFKSVEIY